MEFINTTALTASPCRIAFLEEDLQVPKDLRANPDDSIECKSLLQLSNPPADHPHNKGDMPVPTKGLKSVPPYVSRRANQKLQLWTLDIRDAEFISHWETVVDTSPTLSASERERVMKYRVSTDRKHALSSILLQKALIRRTFNVQDSQFSILRTKNNKPYVCLGPRNNEKGSWNYNVSHHGQFVSIASHSHALIGIDIVEVKLRGTWKKSIGEYVSMFKDQFSAKELTSILKQKTPLVHFFINWSLKEAFIKAIGSGLYFNLVDIEFEITYDSKCLMSSEISGTAVVYHDNIIKSDWFFEFCSLDELHILSVATGPFEDDVASQNLEHAPSGNLGSTVVDNAIPAHEKLSLLTKREAVSILSLLPDENQKLIYSEIETRQKEALGTDGSTTIEESEA